MVKNNSNSSDFSRDGILENLLADNYSGSEGLLFKINDYLKNNYKSNQQFLSLLNTIKNNSKDFQAIQEYLDTLIGFVSKNEKINDEFFEKFENSTYNSFNIIAKKFGKIITPGCKILTLSNSSTLSNVFRMVNDADYRISVTVSESRPQLEGRILAEYLDSHGIDTTLITEADIPNYLPECNFAVIGADKILTDESIVNKRGSKLLALLAKEFAIPLIVLARRTKICSFSQFVEIEKNVNEIWDTKNKSITMKNYYFEVVQKELIYRIITDE